VNNALQAMDSERSVLGSCLEEPHRISEAAALLCPSDFTLEAHRRLFAAFIEMQEQGKPVDPLTVCEHVGREIERFRGSAFLVDLMTGVVPESATYHAGVVKDRARRRALRAACASCIASVEDSSQKTGDCFSRVEESLLSIDLAATRPTACKSKDFQTLLRGGYTVQMRYSFKESSDEIVISIPPRSCGY